MVMDTHQYPKMRYCLGSNPVPGALQPASAPMPRLPDASLRDRLVAAAIRVFARAGYAAATLDRIAAEAGVTKGGIYFHFQDKEAIFLALQLLDVLLLKRFPFQRHQLFSLGCSKGELFPLLE